MRSAFLPSLLVMRRASWIQWQDLMINIFFWSVGYLIFFSINIWKQNIWFSHWYQIIIKGKWGDWYSIFFFMLGLFFAIYTLKYTTYPPIFLLQCYFDLRFGPSDTYFIGWCSFGCQILLRESAGALALYYGSSDLRLLSKGVLFGLSPLVGCCHYLLGYTWLELFLTHLWSLLSAMQLPSLHIWITDAGYMIFSTLISVVVHEFGHAVAVESYATRDFTAVFGFANYKLP